MTIEEFYTSDTVGTLSTIITLSMFSYGIFIFILIFFKRNKLLKKILPLSVQNEPGLFSFGLCIMGAGAMLDLTIPLKQNDPSLSAIMLTALGAFLVGAFIINCMYALYKRIPEE